MMLVDHEFMINGIYNLCNLRMINDIFNLRKKIMFLIWEKSEGSLSIEFILI